MGKIGDKIFEFLKLLLLVILSGMTIIGFLQVLARYVLKIPLPWAEELLRYLFIWMILLGGAVAVRTKGQIAMTLVINRLGVKSKSFVNIFVSLLTTGFLVYLAYSGYNMAMMNVGQKSDALGISMAIPYLALPFGSIIMIFFLLEGIVFDIKRINKNSQLDSGGD